MINKKLIPIFLIYSFLLALILGCKEKRDSDKKNNFKGKWDLILWNNRRMDGTFVFTDSLAFFNLNYFTDISKYKINNDTMRFTRIGGSMSYLSGSEYWIIEQSDTLTFKIISSDGNIATAYKEKYFKDFDKEPPKDPDVIEL
jgi:hypothetical protein